MYEKKIRRTENAIAGLITMLEILRVNTNVLVNLRRIDGYVRKYMLKRLSEMVTDLEEMVKTTKCLEILREWGDVECLGHWEDDYDGHEASNGVVTDGAAKCVICNGKVSNAEGAYKVLNRLVKETRNFMKAYSVLTEVPMKELTARQFV